MNRVILRLSPHPHFRHKHMPVARGEIGGGGDEGMRDESRNIIVVKYLFGMICAM